MSILALAVIVLAAKPKDDPKTATLYIYRTGQFMAAGNNWSISPLLIITKSAYTASTAILLAA